MRVGRKKGKKKRERKKRRTDGNGATVTRHVLVR